MATLPIIEAKNSLRKKICKMKTFRHIKIRNSTLYIHVDADAYLKSGCEDYCKYPTEEGKFKVRLERAAPKDV